MFQLIKSSLMVAIVITMLSTFAAAQIQISGKVLEAQTKEPLIGATVLQTGTNNGVSTNTDGSFEIDLLDGEESSIRISFTGFKSETITVVRSHSELKILLLPDTYVSDEVLVEATRVDESIPVTFSNLDKEEIQKRNLGQDVPYLLNLTPSTVVTSDAG
ncbi:MAG TPA: TonB-dependent receptor, partial [Balneola sp.]|nr:TonB-dependent receptor [Balneola sp.]